MESRNVAPKDTSYRIQFSRQCSDIKPILPKVTIHKNGQTNTGEVAENANLVVRTGIRQFPYPHLTYGCGMGKCGKCASRVLSGSQHLPPPNWKEQKVLGNKLEEGYRLICQLWIDHDLEILQEPTPPPSPRPPVPRPPTA